MFYNKLVLSLSPPVSAQHKLSFSAQNVLQGQNLTGFIPIWYHPCLVDEENLVPGLIFVVTFRIFTAGKEARRLMALAQALAKKPSLQRACFPDHVCRPKLPSKPDTWKTLKRLYFCHQNLKDHFSHGRPHCGSSVCHKTPTVRSQELWVLLTSGWVACCNWCWYLAKMAGGGGATC